jgi:hypothetical protein
MGVRLYPILKEGVTLEQFLNLPEGTEARLRAHEAKRPQGNDFVAYEAWANLLDGDMGLIYNFELYGWGKFRPCNYQKDGEYVSCSGKELNRDLWFMTLRMNSYKFGIENEVWKSFNNEPSNIDMLDGVSWG